MAKPLSWIGEKGKSAFKSIKQAIQNNGPTISRFKTAGMEIGTILKDAFVSMKPALSWLANEGIPLARDALITLVEKGLAFYNLVKNNWSTIKPLLIGLGIALVSVKTAMMAMTIVQTVTGFIKGFRAATAAARLTMLGFNGALLANPMTWVVAGVMALIAAGILLWQNWDKVSAFLISAWARIQVAVKVAGAAIKMAFLMAYQFVINTFSGIGSWFLIRFNLVKNRALSVGRATLGAFRSAYNGIISLFSGLGNWFAGVFNGVTGSFRGGVNTLIGIANRAISSLNGISVSIPGWVPKIGGKSFGVNIPNIPYLAEGGITTGATLAMIGEGAEQEAVLPLSKLQSLIDGTGGGDTTNSYVSGDESVDINYNPQFVIQGNADEQVIQQALELSESRFEQLLKKYIAKNKRLKF